MESPTFTIPPAPAAQDVVAKVMCNLCRRFVQLAATPLRTYDTRGGQRRTSHVCAHHSINGRTHAEELTAEAASA